MPLLHPSQLAAGRLSRSLPLPLGLGAHRAPAPTRGRVPAQAPLPACQAERAALAVAKDRVARIQANMIARAEGAFCAAIIAREPRA